MSNTPDTEVLRIEGNVTVPMGDYEKLNSLFYDLFIKTGYHWEGSIVPQDSPTGMRLYRVEEVEGYKSQIATAEKIISDMVKDESENDKAFLSLSEELTSVKAGREGYKQAYERVEKELLEYRIKQQQSQDANLIGIWYLKERNKENTRWRTFTKWWKELWD